VSDKLEALAQKDTKTARRRKLSLFPIPISSKKVAALTTILDRRLLPTLRELSEPIPRSTITHLRKNYEELLPKTMRVQTADLNGGSSKAQVIANSLGITTSLQSDELRNFGERVTGKRLLPNPGCQVVYYGPGDFSGPHTDHHPEDRDYRDGYVDIHIMLSSPAVASQLLVHEGADGMLDVVHEVGHGLSIAVYQLPFWHYTTPMVARARAPRASRWLLLATYILDRGLK
jgi:hypothetical protein